MNRQQRRRQQRLLDKMVRQVEAANPGIDFFGHQILASMRGESAEEVFSVMCVRFKVVNLELELSGPPNGKGDLYTITGSHAPEHHFTAEEAILLTQWLKDYCEEHGIQATYPYYDALMKGRIRA